MENGSEKALDSEKNEEIGVFGAENRVLDPKKVEQAISGILDALAGLGCTVAESIQAVRSVDFALGEMYGSIYKALGEAVDRFAADTSEILAEEAKTAG